MKTKYNQLTLLVIVITIGLIFPISNVYSGIILSYIDKKGKEIQIEEYLIWYEVPKKLIKKITQPNSNTLIKVIDYDEQLLKPTLSGEIIRNINLSPNDDNRIYAGLKGHQKGDGKVLVSNNNAINWIALNENKPLSKATKDVQVIVESPHNPNLIYAGTWDDGFYRSIDKGLHFEKVENFPARDIRSVIFHDNDENLILVATTTHGIIYSIDAGKTWRVRKSQYLTKNFHRTWKLAQSPFNQNTLYALTFGALYVSYDFSTSWQRVIYSAGDIFSAITFENEFTIYVTSGDFKTSKLYKTIDAGKTFEQYGKRFNDYFNDIISISGHVLLGGDHAMYELKGKEIIPSTIPVPFPTISQFIIKGEFLWIATWGNGLIKKEIAKLLY